MAKDLIVDEDFDVGFIIRKPGRNTPPHGRLYERILHLLRDFERTLHLLGDFRKILHNTGVS